MIKRRARAADLPASTCCHTFRATGITAYLQNGGTLEHAQAIAAHESPRTTKLYDRTNDEITLDEVERILGPAQESGRGRILSRFLEGHEFGRGRPHPLRLE